MILTEMVLVILFTDFNVVIVKVVLEIVATITIIMEILQWQWFSMLLLLEKYIDTKVTAAIKNTVTITKNNGLCKINNSSQSNSSCKSNINCKSNTC